jgi:hypothetical protein
VDSFGIHALLHMQHSPIALLIQPQSHRCTGLAHLGNDCPSISPSTHFVNAVQLCQYGHIVTIDVMDLLPIDYIRACYIRSDGSQVYCDHISVDFSVFALCASVKEIPSNLWQVAKPELEKAVSKVTQDTDFRVQGILDARYMTISEAFELTYAKASCQSAVNVLRNKPALDRCKVTVPGKVEHAALCACVEFICVLFRRVMPRGRFRGHRWSSQMQSRGTLPQHQPRPHRYC